MIGVTHGSYLLGGGLNSLKRDALFFDQISMIACHNTIREWRYGRYSHKSKYQNWANETEFLVESGIVISSDSYKKITASECDNNNRKYFSMCDQLDSIVKEMDSIGCSVNTRMPTTLLDIEAQKLNSLGSTMLNLQLRLAAEEFKVFKDTRACSIVAPSFTDNVHKKSISQGDVLKLCVDHIPVPSLDTSWKQIIEMRFDEDLKYRARKLKLWSYDIANQDIDLNHANEYLQDLLFEYESYMKLHTKKFSRGTMESIIVGSVEAIEDLVKGRIGKLAQKFFDIKNKHCDLLIAEKEAPGREVSWITKVKEKL